MKILIAVDGSASTKHALAYLTTHAEWLGPQHAYTVLTVVPAVTPRAAAALAPAELQAHYDEEAQSVLGPVRAFLDRQWPSPVRYCSRVGHAAQEILAQIQEDSPDLLLMGSSGHGNWGNLLMGSVATRVLAQSRVPVLLLR